MRVHSRNGKKHVPGQLTLHTQYKLLIISLVDLPGQLVHLPKAQNRRAVKEGWTKTNRWQPGEWTFIPLTKSWNLPGWRANRHNAIQAISVVHRNLVHSVFEGPRVQPIPGGATQQNSLAVQLICSADPGTEVVPVHVLRTPATARRSCSEHSHSTLQRRAGLGVYLSGIYGIWIEERK